MYFRINFVKVMIVLKNIDDQQQKVTEKSFTKNKALISTTDYHSARSCQNDLVSSSPASKKIITSPNQSNLQFSLTNTNVLKMSENLNLICKIVIIII